ncbi:MAG TPA: S41 family peptidase [Novosphingobium sp.]
MVSKPALSLLMLLSFCPLAGAAVLPAPDPNADAAKSYLYVRSLRVEAQKLSAKDAGEADLRQAVTRYEDALRYLAMAPVSERTVGDARLESENVNVLFPLAGTYARLGMKEQALGALEKAAGMTWLPPLAGYLGGPSFASLRDEPRFKAVVAMMALPERLYKAPAITTPYKPVLTVEEKVAGLSLFWSEARRNFVHFDHVPELKWDEVYMQYLGKVIAAPTTRDYYLLMTQLAALLRDGHTNVEMPAELARAVYARPPLRTALVEDKVLVRHVGDEDVARRVRAGEEIVAIDGEPVKQYAERRVAPFVSSSTPQDRAVRVFGYQLLSGDEGQAVRLRLRGEDGAEREELVERSLKYRAPAPAGFKMLPGAIAYIALDQFENDRDVKAFELALPEILGAKGLVIDVRRNGGGSSKFGMAVLSYLTKAPIAGTRGFVRGEEAYTRAQGGGYVKWSPVPGNGELYRAVREQVFTGPVAVLTGAQTFSAAEDFTAAYKIMERGIIVGEATGGSTGQPLRFDLPGGGKARICIKRDVYPDGTSFVGKGIVPDIEVRETVASLRAGRDPVVERALAELSH